MGLFGKISEKRMKDPVEGMLRVVGINRPDPTATSANYRLDGVISGPGIEPQAVRHSGIMSTGKWPSPGEDLPVVFDRQKPTHFVIQKDKLRTGHEQAMDAAEALAAQMRGDEPPAPAASSSPPPQPLPQPQAVSAAAILARGTPGHATLLGTYPSPMPAPAQDRTSIGLMLNVLLDGRQPYQVENLYAVPTEKVARLAPGTLLPVKVDPGLDQLVAVDWDAF